MNTIVGMRLEATVTLRFVETRWETLALSPRKLNKTKFRE